MIWRRRVAEEAATSIPHFRDMMNTAVAYVSFCFSCFFGYGNDTGFQYTTYAGPHGSRSIPLEALLWAVLLCVILGAVGGYLHNHLLVSVFMLILVLLNIVMWTYMISRTITRQNQLTYADSIAQQDMHKYLLLRMWMAYIYGSWQSVRLIVSVIFWFIIIIVICSPILRNNLEVFARNRFPDYMSGADVFGSIFCLFVVIFEGSIWFARACVHVNKTWLRKNVAYFRGAKSTDGVYCVPKITLLLIRICSPIHDRVEVLLRVVIVRIKELWHRWL